MMPPRVLPGDTKTAQQPAESRQVDSADAMIARVMASHPANQGSMRPGAFLRSEERI